MLLFLPVSGSCRLGIFRLFRNNIKLSDRSNIVAESLGSRIKKHRCAGTIVLLAIVFSRWSGRVTPKLARLLGRCRKEQPVALICKPLCPSFSSVKSDEHDTPLNQYEGLSQCGQVRADRIPSPRVLVLQTMVCTASPIF